jgi:probable HAF family extracellular repeat protein
VSFKHLILVNDRGQSEADTQPYHFRGGHVCSAGAGRPLDLLRKYARLIGCALPLAAALVGCTDTVSPAPRATFRNLGVLSGYASSQASALSSDGAVVAGTSDTTAGNRQAFRWTAQQGMSGLGFLSGGSASRASGTSADGAVVVGDGDANNGSPPTASAGFRWTAQTGAQRIAALPGSPLCAAAGVSGDGAVVAGTCVQANNTAFRWTAATGPVALSRLGPGSNQQGTATAISRDGSVIAGAGHPVLTGAAIWSADGSATILGKLPGDAEGVATALSSNGSVVAGVSTSNTGTLHAFRWTSQSGMVDLGAGGGGLPGTFATSISDDGRIIVGWGPSPSGDMALIWDADRGWRRLDTVLAVDYRTQVPGWTLNRATAISGDGRGIAGYGTNPQGQTEAWIVNLPE